MSRCRNNIVGEKKQNVKLIGTKWWSKSDRRCDRHGYKLDGASPAMALKEGNMQAKARGKGYGI